MKNKKKIIFSIIIIIILLIIILFLIFKSKDQKEIKKQNDTTKEQAITKNIEKEQAPKEEKIKEEIKPIYKILVPSPKITCSEDNCITINNIKNINDYVKSKYPVKKQDNHTYIVKDKEYVEVVFDNNDESKANKEEYKYILNNKTTVDDIKTILEKEKTTPTNEQNEQKETNTNSVKNKKNTNTKSKVTNSKVNQSKTNTYASQIAVLNYHFFYDKTSEKCNESICLDIKNFENQLKYLKNNNFKTLTMEEFRAWMYGEKELPKKSVLLTIDDGAMGTGSLNGNKLIPLLEKYQMNATLFLITGWWDKENYQSKYLNIQSHGDLIHENAKCSDGNTKPRLQCLNHDELKEDFTKSIAKVDNNLSFCYPFYSYNKTAQNVLKELNFKLAFIGGNTKAKRSNNKYLIPRYIIYKNTSLESFKNMVN